MRFVIADDHPVVRKGLRIMLEEKGYPVVGEAKNGAEAIRVATEQQPCIAVVDLNLPDKSGIEVTEEIKLRAPSTRVIMFSMHLNDFYLKATGRKNADGYVSKQSLESELVPAIREVAAGRNYRSAGKSSSRHESASRALRIAEHPESVLSLREYQVLQLLAAGCQNKDVAQKLCISVRTAEKHRGMIMRKLNLKNHAQLIHFALHNNVIQIPELPH